MSLRMNGIRLVGLLLFASFITTLAGCAKPERTNVLKPDGSASFTLMNFDEPLSLDPMTPGWFHRTFRRHPPMDISFVTKEERAAVRLSTDDSASMLFRWVDVDLEQYPLLSWDWFIEQPIEATEDERTTAGDDHPARLYLGFESASGEEHSMEIIWGNRDLQRGDWKHLKFFGFFSFPHFVANGGARNVGRWHRERVSLSELYSTLWGDAAGARLTRIALFCDSDETDGTSIAYFADVVVEKSGS